MDGEELEDIMKNCVKCSSPLQDKDKFCPECGQKVLKDTSARTIPCPNTIQDELRTPEPCLEEIKEGKRFCNQCGWRINPACFQPGAKMCSGTLRNGALCDNIVTPDIMFCSKCGTPPDSGPHKTDDTNSSTNNSNSFPPVVQEQFKLDSAQKSEASTNANSQLLMSYAVVNKNENPLDSNGNSVGICDVVADMKKLSFKDSDKTSDVRSTKTDEGQEEREMDTQQSVHGAPHCVNTGHLSSPRPGSTNKQLNIEQKSRTDLGRQKQTSVINDLNNAQQFGQGRADTHSECLPTNEAISNSEQEGKETKVQPSSSAVQQELDMTKFSQSGNNTRDHDVEKSSDIWVPPNEQKENIATTKYVTAASAKVANREDKMEGSGLEGNHEQKSYQCEQQSEEDDKDGKANEEDLEESDSDSDSKSEEDSDKGKETVTGGTKLRKRPKQRKKGKEKYLRKQERKEKSRASKEVLDKNTAPISNALTTGYSSKDTEMEKGEKNDSTPYVATSYPTSKNVSYTTFTSYQDNSSASTSRTSYVEIPVHHSQAQKQSNGSNNSKSSNGSNDGQAGNGSNVGKPGNGSIGCKPGNGSSDGKPSTESNDGKPSTESNDGKPSTESNDGKPGNGSNDGKPRSGSNDGKPSSGSDDSKPGNGSNDGKPSTESNEGSSVDPKPPEGNESSRMDENSRTSTSSGQRTFASVVSERTDKVMTRSKSDLVEIHFQAIASRKFIDNSALNSVRIRFALQDYGGLTNLWPTSAILITDGCVAVSFKGLFSKAQIKTRGIRYCYCVVINNDLSNVADEYVYNAYKVDENNLRRLQKHDIPDVWIQYDGILNPLPEKSVLQKLTSFVGYDSYEKKMEKNLIFSAKYFFPKWKHFFVHGWDATGADMLRQMEMLYEGLHKNVFISCKRWTLEKQFKTFLGKVWLEDLKPKLDELEKKPDLISAIGIIVLAEEYCLPLDATYKNALFRSLVLEGNFEEKKCPMYDKFKESFQGVIPRVKSALLEFIKSVKTSEDPTWLCSLPLYHFLIGKCRPYEAITKRVDHNAKKPLWWGKDDLEIEMDYLKGKTKWSIDPENILQTLAPMFEIDFYLSRSFMSVLKLEKLSVVKTRLLPPEVVMATLYFFLSTDYFETDTKKTITYECLEVAAEQMRKSCDLENISQDQLTRAYLCVKIGADLLSIANSHHRDRAAIVLRAIEAFVVALAVYEQLNKETSKEGNPTESDRLHLVTLNEKRGLINDWLNKLIFYPSVEADLKVWNKLLSMNVPDSSIKDALMTELKDTLRKKLDKEDTLVKEHLVTLYCSDADQLYQPAVQEILGHIAFQALEKGCICEEKVLYGKGAAKYGSMLSRLFERSWEKNHLSTAQPRDILNFTLSWKPFMHFQDMFCKSKYY